jgi:folate-binding protein YgfZ
MQATLLDQFGFLAIRGKDATSFLQGYTTCDLEQLSNSQALLGAICNIQGRMVANFRVSKLSDGLLLRLNRNLVAKTMTFLGKYIVFSKAEMSDMSEDITCYGVIGNPAISATMEINEVSELEGNILVKISESGPRYEIWAQNPVDYELLEDDSWSRAEIEDGFAWVNETTTEEFIPQMFDYQNRGGIDFDKGCYLGQEIIARLEHRGALNRKLHRGTVISSAKSGDKLISDVGKPIGTVVSAAAVDVEGGQIFLAVLQNKGDEDIQVNLEDGESALFSPVSQ